MILLAQTLALCSPGSTGKTESLHLLPILVGPGALLGLWAGFGCQQHCGVVPWGWKQLECSWSYLMNPCCIFLLLFAHLHQQLPQPRRESNLCLCGEKKNHQAEQFLQTKPLSQGSQRDTDK